MTTIFRSLREANIARQAEWDQDGRIDLAYRGNELAGEAGEACNIIKELERERLGIRGSRSTLGDLADELADVAICLDLIGIEADQIPCVELAITEVVGRDGAASILSLSARGCSLAHRVGRVCRAIEVVGLPGTEHEMPSLRVELLWAACEVAFIAYATGIGLAGAIEEKFNATSIKYGLATRYHPFGASDDRP